MTDIVDVPQTLPIAPFPALGSANYNQEAYDNGVSVPPAIERLREIVDAGHTNALAANERAVTASSEADRATTQANAAASSASAASGYASAASTSASNAAISASAAESAYIEASKLNLGDKSTPPTLDNQGQSLRAGATYYDTTLNQWRVWNGAQWTEGISAVAGVASVDGKTGSLTLSDTSYQAATQTEMELGTEVALRSMSPALVRKNVIGAAADLAALMPNPVPAGTGVVSAVEMPSPEWLRAGVNYLTAGHPQTAKSLGRLGLEATGAPPVGSGGAEGLSSSPGKVVGMSASINSGAIVIYTFLVTSSGVISPLNVFNVSLSSVGTSATQVNTRQSADGNFCSVSFISDGKYYLVLLKWNAATQKWTLVAKIIDGITVSNPSWQLAHVLSDDGTKVWVPRIDYAFSAISRYDINTTTGSVSARVSIGLSISDYPRTMHYHNGRMFVMWFGSLPGGGGLNVTRWGLYNIDSSGAFVQAAVGEVDSSPFNPFAEAKTLDGRYFAASYSYSGSTVHCCIDMATADFFKASANNKTLVGIIDPGVIVTYGTATSPYSQGHYKVMVGSDPTVVSVGGYYVDQFPTGGAPIIQVSEDCWVMRDTSGNLVTRKRQTLFQIAQPVSPSPAMPYAFYFRSFDT